MTSLSLCLCLLSPRYSIVFMFIVSRYSHCVYVYCLHDTVIVFMSIVSMTQSYVLYVPACMSPCYSHCVYVYCLHDTVIVFMFIVSMIQSLCLCLLSP